MATNPAPKNIYDLCNEVYARHGQYGVFDYVGKFDNIEWTWCMPCESVTPFDPYHETFIYNEDTALNDKEVSCLVCGSINQYVNYKKTLAFVLYSDGTTAVQSCEYKDQLKFLQSICQGYVEKIDIPSEGVSLWVNENARLHNASLQTIQGGLAPNFNATKIIVNAFGDRTSTVLLGNVVVTSNQVDTNHMITSLTNEQIERLMTL